MINVAEFTPAVARAVLANSGYPNESIMATFYKKFDAVKHQHVYVVVSEDRVEGGFIVTELFVYMGKNGVEADYRSHPIDEFYNYEEAMSAAASH